MTTKRAWNREQGNILTAKDLLAKQAEHDAKKSPSKTKKTPKKKDGGTS